LRPCHPRKGGKRGRRAAEERDELAPLQLIELHSVQRRKQHRQKRRACCDASQTLAGQNAYEKFTSRLELRGGWSQLDRSNWKTVWTGPS
jgi:hypothetical protein